MISVQNLAFLIGHRVLFADVDVHLSKGSRYALVGANGTGKSTFMKLLMGEEEPDDGNVTVSKSAVIGWLKQDQHLFDEEPILHVVLRGRAIIWDLLQKKEALLNKGLSTDKEMHEFSDLEERYTTLGGYSAQSEAEAILEGLGIQRFQDPLKVLSGGYKLRVLLARTLFEHPNILLLDEPTNYLDIVSIAWLETYLVRDFNGLLVITSHDHEFLNRVATHILDVDYGEIRTYRGNYDAFIAQKMEVVDQIMHERRHLEEKRAHMQKFIDKLGAKASKAKQAKAREKAIEKLEWPDTKESSRRAPNFHFSVVQNPVRKVLEVKNLSFGYDDKLLFENFSLSIERGEKVAITGANGVGKSTLLKCLLGELELLDGTVEWGERVEVSYFAQEHAFMKVSDETVLDWLGARAKGGNEAKKRALGQMLFSEDDYKKKVSAISGGEATRVILAKMMLEKGNMLIFDEPTNHLDLESREALANALAEFPGTILFISHDRCFIDKVATRRMYF